MKRIFQIALTLGALLSSSAALADPIQINGDEGYTRLARWEKHLDDTIAGGVRNHSLDTNRAWRLQVSLDSIEMRVLQRHYQSPQGITFDDFHAFAGQLHDVGAQIGDDEGWGQHNVFGNGWNNGGFGGHGGYGPPPPPPPPQTNNYYRNGDYERDCQRGNPAAGTIFGAIAGGMIGGAASHGNGGAVAGGIILGGLLGNTLAGDVHCEDHRVAFESYSTGLNGEVGREYRWQHNANYGTFKTVREYRDDGYVCRDFHTVTYRDGQRFERDGTACRQEDGNWRFR